MESRRTAVLQSHLRDLFSEELVNAEHESDGHHYNPDGIADGLYQGALVSIGSCP